MNRKNLNKSEIKETFIIFKEYISSLTEEEKDAFLLENSVLQDRICKNYYRDDIRKLFDNFKTADSEDKKFLIDQFVGGIIRSTFEINSTYAKHLCERNGHIYGNWEKYEKTHEEKSFYFPYNKYTVIDETGWRKICTICGDVVEKLKEPEELKTKRKKRDLNERIKRLENILDNLKVEQEKMNNNSLNENTANLEEKTDKVRTRKQ